MAEAAYRALKAVRFGSVDYREGDTVPAGAILPKRERALLNMGIIARVEAPTEAKTAKGTPSVKPQEAAQAASKAKPKGDTAKAAKK